MSQLPRISTLPDTRFPYTTLLRSPRPPARADFRGPCALRVVRDERRELRQLDEAGEFDRAAVVAIELHAGRRLEQQAELGREGVEIGAAICVDRQIGRASGRERVCQYV